MVLPAAVHVRRDADLDPEPLGGLLECGTPLLNGLVAGRMRQFGQPLRVETFGLAVGLLLRHRSHRTDRILPVSPDAISLPAVSGDVPCEEGSPRAGIRASR